MRSKIEFDKYRRLYTILFTLIVLYFLMSLFSSYTCHAQGEEIAILLTDLDDQSITQITEGESFKISVYDPELDINPFLVDVEITFNNTNYTITNETENSEIIIKAPLVNEDKSFKITANKGYLTNQTTIIVKDTDIHENKTSLIIAPPPDIIESDKDFYVTVTDDTTEENLISGVTVYIVNHYDQRDTTDSSGRAYFHAPKNKEEITIYATKEGYTKGSIELRVISSESWWKGLIENEYFVFSIAILILISVIIFVHFRQKKSIEKRTSEITKEKQMEKYGFKKDADPQSNNNDPNVKSSSIDEVIRVNSNPESKVEEIRISKPRKEKKVVPIKTEEEKAEKIVSEKKNKMHNYEWFEGKEDVKYEIDKLTGEIDEEGLDKWFEGVDNLKQKIDEKVKKDKNKKKEKKE